MKPNRRISALFSTAQAQQEALGQTYAQISEFYTEEADEAGEDL